MKRPLNNEQIGRGLTAIAVLIAIAGAAFISPYGPLALGVGNSMEPTIQNPSIVVCTPIIEPQELDQGDIIAYDTGDEQYLHRVTENKHDYHALVTDGDNQNVTPPTHFVEYNDVLCKYQGHLTITPLNE